MSEALAHANIYTEEDYYNLPENVRAEQFDGKGGWVDFTRSLFGTEIVSDFQMEEG